MDEGEWLTATDPGPMLEFLRDASTVNGRKLRLFASACCRCVWHLLTRAEPRRAIEAAERFADGLAGGADLATARAGLRAPARARLRKEFMSAALAEGHAAGVADARTVAWAAAWDAAREAVRAVPWEAARHAASAVAVARRYDKVVPGRLRDPSLLLRDLFGNPFRPLPRLAPSLLAWHDALIPRLASASYEPRSLPSGHLDPDRLAVLADALEDAGCPADHELLGHLRADGHHWRGCWALDAVLSRE